jgi:peptidoglycan/LPS O-acetylase OafA/YrhL
MVAPASAASRPRLAELDGLRGLAALTVVLGHLLNTYPSFTAVSFDAGPTWVNALKYTPLHALWSGHEAVMLFFLLSGFVLALPFQGDRRPRWQPFAIKRIARIWLPYVAVLTAAVAARAAFAGDLPDVSDWVANKWRDPLSALDLLQHYSLVGTFDDRQLDPVTWSLAHEMRISLLFPVLMLAVRHTRWWQLLGTAFVVDLMASVAIRQGADKATWGSLQYLIFFVAGALLATHREHIGVRLRRLPERAWPVLVGVGFIAYSSAWLLPSIDRPDAADDWMTGIGAAIFLFAAAHSPPMTTALRARAPQWLGRVSYSLYLVHAVVLLSLLSLLHGRLPLLLILGLVLGLSLGLAAVVHRWVEEPSMALGRRLTRRRPAAPDGDLATASLRVEP